jgi:hypothetical protein
VKDGEDFGGARGLFDVDEFDDSLAEREAVVDVPTCLADSAEGAEPGATEQSRLFDLLGRINYVILRGDPVYLQAGGEVYKILFGLYWQSVFTGARHWGFRCEEVGRNAWAEGRTITARVELPLYYTKLGWVIEVASVHCLLYGDLLSVNGDPFADSFVYRRDRLRT